MRDLKLDRAAADTFQLVVGTLDFAGPKPSVQEFQLRACSWRWAAITRRRMPADMDRLRASVDTILTKKANIQSSCGSSRHACGPYATNLSLAARDLYQTTTRASTRRV